MYRVMLVDDDRALRYVYSKMEAWEKYGFSITESLSNGTQALERLKEQAVDVIFTDIRMPFMDGITMMKEVKKRYPGMHFVLISSYDEFEYAREGLRMGALDYIVKPMSESDLENTLEHLIKELGGDEKPLMTEVMDSVTEAEVNWNDPVLSRLCRYLEQHMECGFTLEEMAEELELNKDYLGKLIKSKTGLSFRSLYHKVKIAYAKPMIKSGKYKVYEISEMLGYTSTDYFTRIFRQHTGMSPAEYKNS